MTGQDLPDADSVVRYVKGTLVDNGRVDGSAFLLRGNEEGLSVNWLEFFSGRTRAQQLDAIKPLVRLKLARSGRFAQLNVGQTLKCISERLDSARIVHRPLSADDEHLADPSHSQIEGLPPGNTEEAELVGDMIAECVSEVHIAVT